MSERRRIGLTMRTVAATGYVEPRDALAQLWPAFMAAALPEADWMYVPNLGDDVVGYVDRWGLTGLVLTGGEDVGSSPLRDATERALLGWAAAGGVPVLGICRGLQLMAVEAGASLGRIDGHVATRHALTGDYAREVNSYHAARLADVPDGYRALARASDGSVEAMAHLRLPWEAWMWHPEREAPFAAEDIHQFREVFA